MTDPALKFFTLFAKGAFAAAFLGPDHAESAAKKLGIMLAAAELDGDVATLCLALVITLDSVAREMREAAELEREIALRSTLHVEPVMQ